jgi:hypothetical protein
MESRTYDRHAYNDEVFAEGVADIARAALAAADNWGGTRPLRAFLEVRAIRPGVVTHTELREILAQYPDGAL